MVEEDYSIFEQALVSFKETQNDLSQKIISAQKRLDEGFSQLDECKKGHLNQLEEYESLKRQLNELKERLGSREGEQKKFEEYEVMMEELKKKVDKQKEAAPRFESHFVRFMMGKVNVKMWKQSEQLKFRDEYNKFKRRTTILFILFPFVQLAYFPGTFVWKLHQAWLVYYYVTLALRENILQGNGSSIQDWWIYHHYISLVICVVSLVWSGPGFQTRVPLLLTFGFFQGCVMFVQNLYQANRSYVRTTLEKQKTIDVETSETLVEKPTNLRILLPLLFIVYAFELLVAGLLFIDWLNDAQLTQYPWQTLLLSLCFLVLFFGNLITIVSILLTKKHQRWLASIRNKNKQLMKRTLSFNKFLKKETTGRK